MARAEGIARGVRIDREESGVVLRFVLEVDEVTQIPVEMRGKKVIGVLDNGDRVAIYTRGENVRGRGGVAHPYQVENLRTSSMVRVPYIILWEEVLKFIVGAVISAASGYVTSFLAGLLTGKSPVMQSTTPEGQVIVGVRPLYLGIAVVVGLIVFFLIYVLPRLRRLAFPQE
jgi:hypothetical protein